jgi:pimeloyl-ACP methyl ester carboxylesterase
MKNYILSTKLLFVALLILSAKTDAFADKYYCIFKNNELSKVFSVDETDIFPSASIEISEFSLTEYSGVTSVNGKVYSFTETSSSYNFDRGEYTIFIPEETAIIRGVFVHQHGCTMEGVGESTAYDLQYQAFAKKWGLAVVGVDLYDAQNNCHTWKDAEKGSGSALFNALKRAAETSGHPELENAPLLLWGHSGGGYWTLSMLKNYPERVLAAVCYSPAFDPQWDYPAATAKIPVLTRHAGANDGNDYGVLCWATSTHTFQKLRNMDAPVSIAHTPSQNHNFSYIRYIAIPFYEAAMKQRMPEGNSTVMRDLDRTQTWLVDTLSLLLYKESEYTGDKKGLCLLPDEYTAEKWKEYVSTGTVTDVTPPSAPYNLKRQNESASIAVLTWKADADIESGIAYFKIYKNGIFLFRFPVSGKYQEFNTNGDNAFPIKDSLMPLRVEATADKNDRLSISMVNHFNIESGKTEF